MNDHTPVTTRVWRPPARPENSGPIAANQWASFRGAVIQNAYAVHLRTHKNAQKPGVDRQMLAAADGRPGAFQKWSDRLNGSAGWNLDDTAIVLLHYPRALPDWPKVQAFLDVATGVTAPQPGWGWPDTMGPPQKI